MPTPTRPGEFLKQDTPDLEYIMDSEVDWIAIWNAKMRQARTAEPELFEEPIHAAISSGEELIETLNVDALTQSRRLIKADLEDESTSFEGLYRRLFGPITVTTRRLFGPIQSVTTVAAAESLRRLSPIKNIAVMNLFAWQIPHLLPDLADRSKSLGGHYWTLLSLQWLVRWDEKSGECPPKDRNPWISMRRYAEIFGT
jgi:hypothetical protein